LCVHSPTAAQGRPKQGQPPWGAATRVSGGAWGLFSPEAWFGRVSARRPTFFLLLRQKKEGKEKASRMRCPFAALRAHCVARSGRGLRKLVRCAAFGHAQP